eukprot:scaffold73694_cov31-Attheya_sp.AAC.1
MGVTPRRYRLCRSRVRRITIPRKWYEYYRNDNEQEAMGFAWRALEGGNLVPQCFANSTHPKEGPPHTSRE